MGEPTRQAPETTTELVREAVGEVHHLVQLEVALAREEMQAELRQLEGAAIALGVAAALAIAALALLLVALAAAFRPMWLASLVIGVMVAAAAGAVGYVVHRGVTRKPGAKTRERLELDLKRLKERVA
jgi:uncharacterized membrane protein YqjE